MKLIEKFYYWLKRAVFKHNCATLTTAWGFAFDFLSILEVKYHKAGTDVNKLNWQSTYAELQSQVGVAKMDQIEASQEYSDLYWVNDRLFDLVDAVKKDPCLGKKLDDCVYERYLAKTELQKRFFPESQLIEIKIGYGK